MRTRFRPAWAPRMLVLASIINAPATAVDENKPPPSAFLSADQCTIFHELILSAKKKEAGSFLNQSLPHDPVDPAIFSPLAPEAFNAIMHDVHTLSREKSVASAVVEKLGRLQMLTTKKLVVSITADDPVYRRWCSYRMNHLRWFMDVGRWNSCEPFIAAGKAEGLLEEDAARERLHLLVRKAKQTKHLNSLIDRENQHWINTVLKRTAFGPEYERLAWLMTGDDQAARQTEANKIKHAFKGTKYTPVDWDAPERLFQEAEVHLGFLFDSASSSSAVERATIDALDYAAAIEEQYSWPPFALPPRLVAALAFDGRMDAAGRTAMSAILSAAYARRGQSAMALQIASQVQPQIAAMADGPVRVKAEGMLARANRIGDEEAAAAIKCCVPEQQASLPAISGDVQEVRYAKIALDSCRRTAVSSSDPIESAAAIEGAVVAYRKAYRPKNPGAIVLQLRDQLGANAPSFKLAKLREMEMWTLTWIKKYEPALAIADSIAADYLTSTDAMTVNISVDSLCHAYLYSSYYLHDSARGLRYLDLISRTYPDGRYNQFVQNFQELFVKRLSQSTTPATK